MINKDYLPCNLGSSGRSLRSYTFKPPKYV